MRFIALLSATLVCAGSMAAEPAKQPTVSKPAAKKAAAAPAAPFDFRGYVLGATLSEVRKMPFPDSDDSPAGDGSKQDLRFVCNGESKDRMGFDRVTVPSDQVAAGTVICQWFVATDEQESWRKQWINITKSQTVDVSFYFWRDGDAEPRLRMISTSVRNALFDEVAKGLQGRFGPAASTRKVILQNDFGARIPSTVMTWNNKVSSIVLSEHSYEADMASLTYTHKALDAGYDAAYAKSNAATL